MPPFMQQPPMVPPQPVGGIPDNMGSGQGDSLLPVVLNLMGRKSQNMGFNDALKVAQMMSGQGDFAPDPGIGVVDQLQDSLNNNVGLQDSGPLARLVGFGRGIAGKLGFDPEAQIYNNLAKGSAVRLARAMGETGPLSNQDLKRYTEMIPGISSSRTEADKTFDILRELMGNAPVMQRNNQVIY